MRDICIILILVVVWGCGTSHSSYGNRVQDVSAEKNAVPISRSSKPPETEEEISKLFQEVGNYSDEEMEEMKKPYCQRDDLKASFDSINSTGVSSDVALAVFKIGNFQFVLEVKAVLSVLESFFQNVENHRFKEESDIYKRLSNLQLDEERVHFELLGNNHFLYQLIKILKNSPFELEEIESGKKVNSILLGDLDFGVAGFSQICTDDQIHIFTVENYHLDF